MPTHYGGRRQANVRKIAVEYRIPGTMMSRSLSHCLVLAAALLLVGVAWPLASAAKDSDGGGGGGSGESGGGDGGGRGRRRRRRSRWRRWRRGARPWRRRRRDSRGDRDEDGGRRGRGAVDLAPDIAREAVSKGWALSLGAVLPTVAAAVPGDVLDVHLQQVRGGDWIYEVLVLTPTVATDKSSSTRAGTAFFRSGGANANLARRG